MAWQCVQAVLDTHVNLSSTEVLILVVLANYADASGGSCYPSRATIARKSRLTERWVTASMGRLRKRGLISVISPPCGRRAAMLQINLPALRHVAEMKTEGEPASAVGVNPVPRRPELSSPDPSDSPLNQQTPAAPVFCPRPMPATPPFRVYAAIAKKAASDSLAQDGDVGLANVIEHFKRRCARDPRGPYRYDGDIARKACEAALTSMERGAPFGDHGSCPDHARMGRISGTATLNRRAKYGGM